MMILPIKTHDINIKQSYSGKNFKFLKTCRSDSVTFSGKFNNDSTKRFVILIGPPNSGKGTMARALSKHYSIPYISAGDILRDKIKKGKNFNNIAEQYRDILGSVPKYTQLVKYYICNVIKEKLKLPEYKNGAIIEGFPRCEEEANMLNNVLDKERNAELKVVHLDVKTPLLYMRSASRFICNECNKTYSLEKVTGLTKCECGGSLVKRDDDTPEILGKRIQKYERETLPLIKYYGDNAISISVNDSNTKSDEILGKIIEAISEKEHST